jgi:RNA polymerase sigma-70 factor (sigma-E family)
MPPVSFPDFVAAHAEDLLRTAHLVTGDEGEAEDLVQECLLRLAPRWGRVGEMDYPLAYARRVLVNLAVRGSGRRARREAELKTELSSEAMDSAPMDLIAEREELWAALRQISARQRVVLVLRYFNDLSEAEVAEMLGITTGTVSSTASRSLAQLRDLMDPARSQARS